MGERGSAGFSSVGERGWGAGELEGSALACVGVGPQKSGSPVPRRGSNHTAAVTIILAMEVCAPADEEAFASSPAINTGSRTSSNLQRGRKGPPRAKLSPAAMQAKPSHALAGRARPTNNQLLYVQLPSNTYPLPLCVSLCR